MKFRFRLKLFLIMIVFAIVLTFSIASIDYMRLKEQAIENNEFQIEKTEEAVEYALQTIDKAYFLFDQETAATLETHTTYLMDYYKSDPLFDNWDFAQLHKMLGVDIYIINEDNVITHSNLDDEIGLDFSKCCQTLERILNERRQSGGFFVDGMDVEQSTGEVKRYSYMATPDKKYLIELGYSLEDGTIFEQFNFLSVIDDLISQYPSIQDINILNLGGLSFGEEAEGLPADRRRAFEWTRASKQTTEVKMEEQLTTYRYVHYASDLESGVTQNKVLEIIYNEREFQTILSNHKKTFIGQLLVVLAVTILISLIISQWVSKPMYLAFHDSLTGLKNRAAFNERLKELLEENRGTTALLMMDLDDFKLVNDYFGHDKGDQLLQVVAQTIDKTVGKHAETFRVGGDEFTVIMPLATKKEAEKAAHDIIEALSKAIHKITEIRRLNITVSIGISFAPQHGLDPEALYKKADIALYASKEKGKNQFHVCSSDLFNKNFSHDF